MFVEIPNIENIENNRFDKQNLKNQSVIKIKSGKYTQSGTSIRDESNNRGNIRQETYDNTMLIW